MQIKDYHIRVSIGSKKALPKIKVVSICLFALFLTTFSSNTVLATASGNSGSENSYTSSAVLTQNQAELTGRITDRYRGEPLPGVSIFIPNIQRGATTNLEGRYSIGSIPPGTYRIQVRFLGYESIEREITLESGQSLQLDFEMAETTIGLDEVIVTGTAGDTRRRAIGNAVSRIPAEEMMARSSRSNISEILQSSTPGLTLIPGSGTAGTSANIRLRGAGSITARTQPVVYVDGIRIGSGSLGNFDVFGQNTSALDMLDPNDIESIEVIKGPAASTLYGAEAAAGVIQVITKSGARGEPNMRWNYRSEFGVSSWSESMRPTNYTMCTPERISDSANWPGCTGRSANEIISNIPLSDNPNALRDGFLQNHSLSVQGGAQQYSYFLSGTISTEEGVFYPNYSDRGAFRANFQVFLLDNLDFRGSFNYNRSEIGLPLGDNTADGLIISSWLANPGRFYGATGTTGYFTINPEDFNTYDNVTSTDRYTVGGTINYEPFDWMENRLRVGYDLSNGRAEIFFPPGNPFAARTSLGLNNENGLIAKAAPRSSELTIDYNGTIRYRINENITSNTSFGAQYLSSNFSRPTMIGQDTGSGALRSLQSAAVTFSGESFIEQKSLGFYLQEQLAFNDRLFLTAAIRMDNNSAFGSEIESVFYPKFSASYVISEESFFDFPSINELRIRAAWGQAGNSPGPFDAIQTYRTTATTIPAPGDPENVISVSSLIYSAIGNPDLKPERGSEFEVGFDLSMLSNRVNLEATYYNTRTRDALVSIPVPPSGGFSGNQLQNLGEVSNQGIELLLRTQTVRGSRFSMENQVTVTTNKNELTTLGLDTDAIIFGVYAPVHQFREGYPLGAFWADRVLRDGGGNVVYNDAGNPVIESQQVYRGPAVPTREVGFGTTFNFLSNLQLYVLLDYKGGHYQFNVKDWRRDRSMVSWATVNPDADPDDVNELRFPRQTYRHVQPADFIKLRDVSLRYMIPVRFTNSLGIHNASVTLTGRNLAVWTRYGGADPEVNFHGDATFNRNDSWTLPMVRRLSAVLNIQF